MFAFFSLDINWAVLLSRIANDFPGLLRRDDRKFKRRSYTWLIEAREKSMAKERLQMRKNVDLTIFRVFIEVESRTIGHIRVPEVESNIIFFSNF